MAEPNGVGPEADPRLDAPGKGPRVNFRGQVGITILCSSLATIVFLMIRMALDLDVSKVFYPLVAFPLNLLIVFRLYPMKLRVPFGEVSASDFSRKIGLYMPRHPARVVLLGVVLAACTLTGMLIASLLTGRYVFDIDNLSFEQIAFSTVPGVWEEVYFRGIIMMVLLFALKDLRRAMVVQCVIFGLLHFQGVGLWELVDIFSVTLIALVLVYATHRTNILLSAIVFHFLHDAFIFVVQVPDGEFIGTFENTVFFACLWAMLGVGTLVIKYATERWEIGEPMKLYDPAKAPT